MVSLVTNEYNNLVTFSSVGHHHKYCETDDNDDNDAVDNSIRYNDDPVAC